MINYLVPLLWWNVIFFCFLCFIGWSNFIASAVFWTTLLEAVLQHIFQFLLKYPSIFFHIYHQIFLQMTKRHILFSVFCLCWISHFCLYPMISVKLTLSLTSKTLFLISIFNFFTNLICKPNFNRRKFSINYVHQCWRMF